MPSSFRLLRWGGLVAALGSTFLLPVGCNSDEDADSTARDAGPNATTDVGTPLELRPSETVTVSFDVLGVQRECGIGTGERWVRADLSARRVSRGVYDQRCDAPAGDAGGDGAQPVFGELVEKTLSETDVSQAQVDQIIAETAKVRTFTSTGCLGYDGISYVVTVGPPASPRLRYRDGISFECATYATGLNGLFQALSALAP